MINVIARVDAIRSELATAIAAGAPSARERQLLDEFDDAVRLLIKCYEHGVRGDSAFAEMDDGESVWISGLRPHLPIPSDAS